MQQIPSDWVHDYKTLDDHYRLSRICVDPTTMDNIYCNINLLEFFGRNYSYWDIKGPLASAYFQNYLTILSSIIEGILASAFQRMEASCLAICAKEENCPYFFSGEKRASDGTPLRNSELTFRDLLAKAEEIGILQSFSKDDLDQLRHIRNHIHLSSQNSSIQGNEVLSVATINEFQRQLKGLVSATIEWLDRHEGKCLKKTLK
jgi:hypothetical protein